MLYAKDEAWNIIFCYHSRMLVTKITNYLKKTYLDVIPLAKTCIFTRLFFFISGVNYNYVGKAILGDDIPLDSFTAGLWVIHKDINLFNLCGCSSI